MFAWAWYGWRPEDNSVELVLFFHLLGTEARLCGKNLDLLSHFPPLTHTSLPRHILPISDCLVLCVSRTHYYSPRKPQGASGSRSSSFSVNSMGSGLPLHSLLPPCFLTLHTMYLGSSHSLQKLTTSLVSGAQIRLCLCCRDCCKWHLCLISFHPQSLLRTILMLSSASCLVLIL